MDLISILNGCSTDTLVLRARGLFDTLAAAARLSPTLPAKVAKSLTRKNDLAVSGFDAVDGSSTGT